LETKKAGDQPAFQGLNSWVWTLNKTCIDYNMVCISKQVESALPLRDLHNLIIHWTDNMFL